MGSRDVVLKGVVVVVVVVAVEEGEEAVVLEGLAKQADSPSIYIFDAFKWMFPFLSVEMIGETMLLAVFPQPLLTKETLLPFKCKVPPLEM